LVIDYQDISAFVGLIVDDALEEGIVIKTIDDLHEYLAEKFDRTIGLMR
jgi:hypothetical protein